MSELARIRDAARVAAKAAHPTDILLTRSGFRVVVRNGGLSTARSIRFDELELARCNPLVDAIHDANRAVTIDADFEVVTPIDPFRMGVADFREG